MTGGKGRPSGADRGGKSSLSSRDGCAWSITGRGATNSATTQSKVCLTSCAAVSILSAAAPTLRTAVAVRRSEA